MIYLKALWLSVFLSLLWLSVTTDAHSSPARPLKRFAHPSTISIEILPRQRQLISELSPFSKRVPSPSHHLRHDDSFRLTIQAFDETFYLHLKPNDHLIHPAARVNYYSIDDQGRSYVTHSKPLLRESVKAYLGEVIASDYSSTRMREDAAGLVSPNPASELGWARIMVHHQGNSEQGIPPQYEGAFSHKGVVYHIVTKENYVRTKDAFDPEIMVETVDSSLVIWRESDVMTPEEERIAQRSETTTFADFKPKAQACGHDRLSYNTDPLQNPVLQKRTSTNHWVSLPFDLYTNGTKIRRDDVGPGGNMGTNFADHIGQTTGCPKSQKLLYMGVAADCEYTFKYGSQDAATKQILTTWNSASSLYKSTFNVSLGIIEVQVQSGSCPSAPDTSIPWNINCEGAQLDKRLSLFSQWRGQKGGDGVGLWHLMSGCPTGSEVGIAWLATICQQESNTGSDGSTVSGTAVSTAGRTEWQVVAHEIGHNFGAIHDCADGCTSSQACCPLSASTCNANAQFIMSPVAQDGEKAFSQCTIGNICSVMDGVNGEKTNTTCLIDAAAAGKTISLQMCGNGIVEQGEDCDPGNGVQSPCCDSATCKFKAGAVCDPESSSCCTDQCSFAPSTQMCRPSEDSRCDTAEFCTGNSSSCPADTTAPNGQSCGSGDLKCASGACTSVSAQCQTIGASLGLKQACPQRNDNTCQVSCQDPNRANQCILLTSLLRDGSPCGYGGTCVSGKCQSGNALDTAKAWYTQNLQIAIPVTIIAGLVVLAILWGIFRSIVRCTRRRNHVPPPPMNPALARAQHQRLESLERSGYDTPAPAFRPPPGTPPFMLPASASYTRVSTGFGPTHGRGNSRSNWVDESAYNGR